MIIVLILILIKGEFYFLFLNIIILELRENTVIAIYFSVYTFKKADYISV